MTKWLTDRCETVEMLRWRYGIVYVMRDIDASAAAAAAAALWSVARIVRGVDFWSESGHPTASGFKSICLVGLLFTP